MTGRRLDKEFRRSVEDHLQWSSGDTLPSLVVQVIDDLNEPVDLTGCQAWFSVRRISGQNFEVNDWNWSTGVEVQIANPQQGIMYYDMQPGDTDTNAGTFEISAVLLFPDGTELTVPSTESAQLSVRDAPDRELISTSVPFGGIGLNRSRKL